MFTKFKLALKSKSKILLRSTRESVSMLCTFISKHVKKIYNKICDNIINRIDSYFIFINNHVIVRKLVFIFNIIKKSTYFKYINNLIIKQHNSEVEFYKEMSPKVVNYIKIKINQMNLIVKKNPCIEHTINSIIKQYKSIILFCKEM